MSQIFLGYPPPKIKEFIIEHYGPKINTTPLTFTAIGALGIQLNKRVSPDNISLEYSIDNGEYTPYTIGNKIELIDGQKMSMRAVNTNDIMSSTKGYYYFSTSGSGKISASGNIQSLIDKTCQKMDVPVYCYTYLFEYCSSLTTAPELPATTLANGCYSSMFKGCSSLTTAPKLPATTLASMCYSGMFSECSNLIEAPKLPATTLASMCYSGMFSQCSKLTQAPELPAATLVNNCYDNMFTDCSKLETISFPNLTKEVVTSNIIEGQYAFTYAASNIQAICQDGILVINSTEA